MSTSPQHEAPHFVEDMRAQFAWMLEVQDKEEDPQPVVYERIRDDDCWRWKVTRG